MIIERFWQAVSVLRKYRQKLECRERVGDQLRGWAVEELRRIIGNQGKDSSSIS